MSPRPVVSALARWRRGRPVVTPWESYLTGVEPALACAPRVHRFARPPLVGSPRLCPVPLAVWIGEDTGDRAERTRAALAQSTVEPLMILNGELHEALSSIRCDYVALVRGGDELAPFALERLGQAAQLAGDANVITCDDDLLTPARARCAPRFRPGPSPDRWLACDDSGPLLVVRREEALKRASRLTSRSAWRHELSLELSGLDGEHHAHVPFLLCHRGADVPDPSPLEPEIVTQLVRQREPSARVRRDGQIRAVHRPAGREPTVEIIICFRDRPELLARCVVSLLARTSYERIRLALVDNGSQQPETARLVNGLSLRQRIRVLHDPRPFNFAALNNRAVASSDADVVVFLNNDTEILTADWIAPLLAEALRPQIGAVAPMLLYPDGTVQHAGAAVGLHGYAGHPFAGLRPDIPTPFGHAAGGTRNWLAVTAACMMVERAKLTQIGGFDESFVVGGNDVDLCLRLTKAGYRSLCVPGAVLLHDESRSRGAHIDPGDFAASERSYGEFRTVGDPFYNPNLTTQRTDCSVRMPGE